MMTIANFVANFGRVQGLAFYPMDDSMSGIEKPPYIMPFSQYGALYLRIRECGGFCASKRGLFNSSSEHFQLLRYHFEAKTSDLADLPG